MSLKKTILFTGLVIGLIMMLGILCNDFFTFDKFQQETMQLLIHQKMIRYHDMLEVLKNQALRQAALFARLPGVIECFEIAHQGDINREDDPKLQEARERLRRLLKDNLKSFQDITGKKFKLHYHLPNGRSLVRLWRKKQTRRNGVWIDISDDISSFRQTVLDVNRLGQPIVGIEIGRGGFVIRGLAPVQKNGKQLGSVEVLISFDPILSCSGREKSVFLLMNKDKLSVASKLKNKPIIGDMVVVKGKDISLLSVLQQHNLLQQLKTNTLTFLDNDNLYIGFPVYDYANRQIGAIVILSDFTKFNHIFHSGLIRSSLIVIVIFVIAGIILGIFLLKLFFKPLDKLAWYAGKVAGGNLYLTLSDRFPGELATLKAAITTMVGNLKERIAEATKLSEQSKEDVQKAREAMKQAEEARRKAETARREGLQEAARKLKKVVEGLVSASDQLSAQAEQIIEGVLLQKKSTEQTATAMEEMNATVLEVARNASQAAEETDEAKGKAENGAHIVDQAVMAINKINELTEALKTNMTQLKDRASGISQVMTVISDIADQTNLLALNAAIEAARAGEAGRGFAVVADEVRKLAEKTMDATREVGNTISEIQTEVDKNVEEMSRVASSVKEGTELAGQSHEALQEIVKLVVNVTEQVRGIATASEEQSAASEEINRLVEDIKSISEETANGMEETKDVVETLVRLAEELRILTEELAKG